MTFRAIIVLAESSSVLLHCRAMQSTIAPLTAEDRKIIHETQKNWMLSDLDVQGKHVRIFVQN
mgnify:CR=1 FL=1